MSFKTNLNENRAPLYLPHELLPHTPATSQPFNQFVSSSGLRQGSRREPGRDLIDILAEEIEDHNFEHSRLKSNLEKEGLTNLTNKIPSISDKNKYLPSDQKEETTENDQAQVLPRYQTHTVETRLKDQRYQKPRHPIKSYLAVAQQFPNLVLDPTFEGRVVDTYSASPYSTPGLRGSLQNSLASKGTDQIKSLKMQINQIEVKDLSGAQSPHVGASDYQSRTNNFASNRSGFPDVKFDPGLNPTGRYREILRIGTEEVISEAVREVDLNDSNIDMRQSNQMSNSKNMNNVLSSQKLNSLETVKDQTLSRESNVNNSFGMPKGRFKVRKELKNKKSKTKGVTMYVGPNDEIEEIQEKRDLKKERPKSREEIKEKHMAIQLNGLAQEQMRSNQKIQRQILQNPQNKKTQGDSLEFYLNSDNKLPLTKQDREQMMMTQDKDFLQKSKAIIRSIQDDYDLMTATGTVPHHKTNFRSQVHLLAKKFKRVSHSQNKQRVYERLSRGQASIDVEKLKDYKSGLASIKYNQQSYRHNHVQKDQETDVFKSFNDLREERDEGKKDVDETNRILKLAKERFQLEMKMTSKVNRASESLKRDIRNGGFKRGFNGLDERCLIEIHRSVKQDTLSCKSQSYTPIKSPISQKVISQRLLQSATTKMVSFSSLTKMRKSRDKYLNQIKREQQQLQDELKERERRQAVRSLQVSRLFQAFQSQMDQTDIPIDQQSFKLLQKTIEQSNLDMSRRKMKPLQTTRSFHSWRDSIQRSVEKGISYYHPQLSRSMPRKLEKELKEVKERWKKQQQQDEEQGFKVELDEETKQEIQEVETIEQQYLNKIMVTRNNLLQKLNLEVNHISIDNVADFEALHTITDAFDQVYFNETRSVQLKMKEFISVKQGSKAFIQDNQIEAEARTLFKRPPIKSKDSPQKQQRDQLLHKVRWGLREKKFGAKIQRLVRHKILSFIEQGVISKSLGRKAIKMLKNGSLFPQVIEEDKEILSLHQQYPVSIQPLLSLMVQSSKKVRDQSLLSAKRREEIDLRNRELSSGTEGVKEKTTSVLSKVFQEQIQTQNLTEEQELILSKEHTSNNMDSLDQYPNHISPQPQVTYNYTQNSHSNSFVDKNQAFRNLIQEHHPLTPHLEILSDLKPQLPNQLTEHDKDVSGFKKTSESNSISSNNRSEHKSAEYPEWDGQIVEENGVKKMISVIDPRVESARKALREKREREEASIMLLQQSSVQKTDKKRSTSVGKKGSAVLSRLRSRRSRLSLSIQNSFRGSRSLKQLDGKKQSSPSGRNLVVKSNQNQEPDSSSSNRFKIQPVAQSPQMELSSSTKKRLPLTPGLKDYVSDYKSKDQQNAEKVNKTRNIQFLTDQNQAQMERRIFSQLSQSRDGNLLQSIIKNNQNLLNQHTHFLSQTITQGTQPSLSNSIDRELLKKQNLERIVQIQRQIISLTKPKTAGVKGLKRIKNKEGMKQQLDQGIIDAINNLQINTYPPSIQQDSAINSNGNMKFNDRLGTSKDPDHESTKNSNFGYGNKELLSMDDLNVTGEKLLSYDYLDQFRSIQFSENCILKRPRGKEDYKKVQSIVASQNRNPSFEATKRGRMGLSSEFQSLPARTMKLERRGSMVSKLRKGGNQLRLDTDLVKPKEVHLNPHELPNLFPEINSLGINNTFQQSTIQQRTSLISPTSTTDPYVITQNKLALIDIESSQREDVHLDKNNFQFDNFRQSQQKTGGIMITFHHDDDINVKTRKLRKRFNSSHFQENLIKSKPHLAHLGGQLEKMAQQIEMSQEAQIDFIDKNKQMLRYPQKYVKMTELGEIMHNFREDLREKKEVQRNTSLSISDHDDLDMEEVKNSKRPRMGDGLRTMRAIRQCDCGYEWNRNSCESAPQRFMKNGLVHDLITTLMGPKMKNINQRSIEPIVDQNNQRLKSVTAIFKALENIQTCRVLREKKNKLDEFEPDLALDTLVKEMDKSDDDEEWGSHQDRKGEIKKKIEKYAQLSKFIDPNSQDFALYNLGKVSDKRRLVERMSRLSDLNTIDMNIRDFKKDMGGFKQEFKEDFEKLQSQIDVLEVGQFRTLSKYIEMERMQQKEIQDLKKSLHDQIPEVQEKRQSIQKSDLRNLAGDQSKKETNEIFPGSGQIVAKLNLRDIYFEMARNSELEREHFESEDVVRELVNERKRQSLKVVRKYKKRIWKPEYRRVVSSDINTFIQQQKEAKLKN